MIEHVLDDVLRGDQLLRVLIRDLYDQIYHLGVVDPDPVNRTIFGLLDPGLEREKYLVYFLL